MLRCHHLHPPLLLLASRPESDPNALARPARLKPTRAMRPSRGVFRPSTLAEAGSDLCRACLTRLRSAFRLPRPLDALLRLQPRRPCFVPATPLGFRLQRLPPPGSRSPSPVRFPSCRFPDDARFRIPCLNWVRSPRPAGRSSKGSSIREIRSAPAWCYPWPVSRSSPGFSSSRYSPISLGSVLPRRLPSWASNPPWTANHPWRSVLFRVSKNRGLLRLSRAAPTSSRSVSSSASPPRRFVRFGRPSLR